MLLGETLFTSQTARQPSIFLMGTKMLAGIGLAADTPGQSRR
jgi:hypothetical protein